MSINLRLTQLHEDQWRVVNNAARFNVLDCGRRWGKNVLAVDRATDAVIRGQPVGWFEPTYKTLSDVWREVVETLRPVTKRKLEQEHRIESMTGGVLEMWSLDNPDVARGRHYGEVIINEAAMVRNLGDIWNMIIRPMLADLRGGAWIFSTPKGRNYFWQMFQYGQDKEQNDWHSWHYPTWSNPHIPKDEIKAMQNSMPERIYSQEIEAAFLDDAGGVFRRVIDATTAVEQTEAQPDREYLIGVDWGKHNDFTVLTVLDTQARAVVHLDRFNQIDYALQVSRLKALAEKFRPASILAESNSMGEPIIEQLQREGLPVQPFQTTQSSKIAGIEALAMAFERGDIAILPDPTLIGELQAYEQERLPSGLMRYGAPEGMHDDMVMSLMIVWHGITGGNQWLIS